MGVFGRIGLYTKDSASAAINLGLLGVRGKCDFCSVSSSSDIIFFI